MTELTIVVAVVVAMLVGIGLCLLGVFCYLMLRMMKGLQDSAAQVVVVSRETLNEARLIVGQVKEVSERNFGDNSPIARSAKAIASLSNALPEVMGGLKTFNDVFSAVYRNTFQSDKVEKTGRASGPVSDPLDQSEFIPYSEEQAAEFESRAVARQSRMTLSEDELAGMRTDKVVERPEVPQEPTPTP